MRFKQGDSFNLSGTIDVEDSDGAAISDLTGWTGSSWVADGNGVLIDNLAFEWIDATTRTVRITKTDTTAWTVGLAYMDIRLTSPAGIIVSTDIENFEIYQGITGVAT